MRMKGILLQLIFLSLCCAVLLAQQPILTPPAKANDFAVSGIVVDSINLQPLPKVRVAIAPGIGEERFSVAVTDDDGRFLFRGLTPRKYSLTAQRRGYVTKRMDEHQGFSTAVVVGPEIDSGHIVFRLDAENSISGTVLDEHGEAARNARVTLFQSAVNSGARLTRRRNEATTDDEGVYRFSHLPAGSYFVSVATRPWYAQRPINALSNDNAAPENSNSQNDAAGMLLSIEESRSPLDVAYPTTFYGGAIEASGATAIVLGKGEKVTADIALQPVPALHITYVSDPSSRAALYPSITEKMFGEAQAVQLESSSLGKNTIELEGIAPGHYTVSLNKQYEFQRIPEGQEVDLSSGGAIDITQSNPPVPVAAIIHTGPSAKLPSQAMISLHAKTAQYFSAQLNDKGEAEFDKGVPPGNYEFLLQRAPDFFTKSISATGANVSGHTVRIKGDGPVKLNVTVGYGQGSVSGSALRNGKPVAGVMIVLVPADPVNDEVAFRRDQSDSDGTFALASVTPGHYTLLAIENGWDLEWANPDVLAPFMAHGEKVTVESKGKYSVKVNVQ